MCGISLRIVLMHACFFFNVVMSNVYYGRSAPSVVYFKDLG